MGNATLAGAIKQGGWGMCQPVEEKGQKSI
jgi:hypothetical protein